MAGEEEVIITDTGTLSENKLSVYPNPLGEELYLVGYSQPSAIEMHLFDSVGKMNLSKTVSLTSSKTLLLDYYGTEELQKGIHILVLKSENFAKIFKMKK